MLSPKISLQAQHSLEVQARALAAAAGVATGSGVAGSAAGFGSSAFNTSYVTTLAGWTLSENSQKSSLTSDLNIAARDQSDYQNWVLGGALSASLGSASLAVAVGASEALNRIENRTLATLDFGYSDAPRAKDSKLDQFVDGLIQAVATAKFGVAHPLAAGPAPSWVSDIDDASWQNLWSGRALRSLNQVTVLAEDQVKASAESLAGSMAISAGSIGLALAGAGSYARNIVLNDTIAEVARTDLTVDGSRIVGGKDANGSLKVSATRALSWMRVVVRCRRQSGWGQSSVLPVLGLAMYATISERLPALRCCPHNCGKVGS